MSNYETKISSTLCKMASFSQSRKYGLNSRLDNQEEGLQGQLIKPSRQKKSSQLRHYAKTLQCKVQSPCLITPLRTLFLIHLYGNIVNQLHITPQKKKLMTPFRQLIRGLDIINGEYPPGLFFKGSQIFGQKNKGSQIFRGKFKGSQINFKV